jgi:hypothetical protein
MEALSPRSTNQMIRPKPIPERKMTDKNAAAGPVQKSSSSKNHADPPPSFVPEPEEGGERYSIGGFLGKGGFAVCYEGTLARNGRLFAMKVVKSQMPQKKMEEKVHNRSHSVGVYERFALTIPSSEQNFKFIPKCAIPSSSNSTEPSHSSKAPMSF